MTKGILLIVVGLAIECTLVHGRVTQNHQSTNLSKKSVTLDLEGLEEQLSHNTHKNVFVGDRKREKRKNVKKSVVLDLDGLSEQLSHSTNHVHHSSDETQSKSSVKKSRKVIKRVSTKDLKSYGSGLKSVGYKRNKDAKDYKKSKKDETLSKLNQVKRELEKIKNLLNAPEQHSEIAKRYCRNKTIKKDKCHNICFLGYCHQICYDRIVKDCTPLHDSNAVE